MLKLINEKIIMKWLWEASGWFVLIFVVFVSLFRFVFVFDDNDDDDEMSVGTL